MLAAPALFIHGAGRAGRAAWPEQHRLERRRQCHYLSRVAPGDPPALMIDQVRDLPAGRMHVVGHSFGGITALLLAATHLDSVRTLTLIEPAALCLSLDRPHTVEHIEALSPVFARADDEATSDLEFSRLFSEASGLAAPDVPEEVLVGFAQQLRATTPPWTLDIDVALVSRIPTQVFIGSTDTMYAEVADSLAQAGAEVHVVPGSGHRPHDHPRFNELVDPFWSAYDDS